MQGESFLVALAQIALGLAGFAGLISLFRRASGDWVPQDFYGIRLIVEFAFATVYLALLPIALFYGIGPGPAIWKISSLLLSGFIGFYLWLLYRRVERMRQKGQPPRHPIVTLLVALFMTGVLVAEVMNAIRWGQLNWYSGGLLCLLIPPSVQFIVLITHVSEDSDSK